MDGEFLRFEIDGTFRGTMTDGTLVEVSEIWYRGDLGETHITYTRDGEERVAIRSRDAVIERTY